MDKLDVLLHPVRLRVILRLQDQELTTAQIADALPDVSKATVYRHIARLVDANVLEVSGEEHKRGTTERRYSLRRGAAAIDEATFAAMTTEDHRSGFTALTASLLAEFNAYLDGQNGKPAESILYGERKIWLNPADGVDFANDVRTLMAKYSGAKQSPGRRAFLAGLILFPTHVPTTGD